MNRVRILLLAGASLSIVPAVLFACGQTQTTADTSDGGPAVGAERGACYPNDTCNAGLVCLSQLCVMLPAAEAGPVPDANVAPQPIDAGPTADSGPSGCGPIPTVITGCFDAGKNVCPDGMCVDFTEAGCPPIVEFVGNFPLQCENDSDCKNGGYCCAGQDFGGPLNATTGNECLVDTSTVSNGASFYARGSSCSPSMCGSPVCRTDSDCRAGQHCAVMHLTDDPNGPSIGGCIK